MSAANVILTCHLIIIFFTLWISWGKHLFHCKFYSTLQCTRMDMISTNKEYQWLQICLKIKWYLYTYTGFGKIIIKDLIKQFIESCFSALCYSEFVSDISFSGTIICLQTATLFFPNLSSYQREIKILLLLQKKEFFLISTHIFFLLFFFQKIIHFFNYISIYTVAMTFYCFQLYQIKR